MFHIKILYLDGRELVFDDPRPGRGQTGVNKVSSAVHLRFDVRASSLPAEVQDALCALNIHRVSKDGVIVIKSQAFRSRERTAPRRSSA